LRFADEEVLATTALTELMKARQLTSGFCYGREGIHLLGHSKLKELKDLLDEIGNKPVIIWCNFQQEVELLLREIPDSVALWGGTDDRQAVIKQFKNGTATRLIANPQSAAHGLTFVNAANAIYYSMSYSYELMKQSQDRIHRIGQGKKCTYHYLLADGTIDEVIYQAVQEKKDLSESVLAYLKNS
jgi:SNF2 family DNA or RNA helicase